MEANTDAERERRIDGLVSEMTRAEKADFVAGSGLWYTHPIERLGIPRMKVSDGPIGVRGAQDQGSVRSACFPNASCLAASFSPGLVREIGRALGQEAHTKGVHVVLGPTVNLHRSPLGGRHFECYSEDPYLSARLAVAFVEGVQGEGVGTSVKHYVCNDSEFERHTISSEVSERALREIYLQPFEAAVAEARPWTIMAAYNQINGTTATEHEELLEGVLKDEWGFDGLVVSDWFALKDGVRAANGGLDLEMPGPPRFFGAKLLEAMEDGRVAETRVDDKCRRILRVMAWSGALDQTDAPAEQAIDRPEHRALARRAAAEGCVLLKNDGDVLPLRADGLRKLAVIGPNAEHTSVQGGGSARVLPHYEVSVLDALRERAGDAGFELVHEPGCTSHKLVPVMSGDLVDSGVAGHRGFQTEYFDGFELEGEPVHARVSRTLERTFFGPFHPDVDPQRFSARFRGTFTPDRAGAHVFALTSAGRSRMFVDGELVIDNWTDPQPGEAWFGRGSREETADVELAAGESAELVIEYSRQGGAAGSAILPELSSMGGLRVGYLEPVPRDLMERAEAAARDADAALVVVGLNAEWETEGHDKQHMRLPGRQAELLERIAAANPRTIAVLNAGGPTDMDWIDAVPAVLQAWYGGQEAGRALVDVLFGDVDPGGRLPTTFARRLEDAPAHTDDAVTYPGENGRVVYAEDLLVGHRHYEANGIEPRFWLGHGLSYARFEYGEASVSSTTVSADEGVEVRVPVRNAAERAGSEVVQLYLADLASRLPRPPRELRAFTKVVLAPGEEALIRLRLGRRDLSYWDPEAHAFVAEPGEFEAAVGRSAGDLRSRVRFTLK